MPKHCWLVVRVRRNAFFSGRERRIGTLVNVNSARLLCLLRCLSFCLSNRVTLLTAISSGCHLRNWAPAVKDDDFLPPSKKKILKEPLESVHPAVHLTKRSALNDTLRTGYNSPKKSRHKDKSSSNFLAVCRTRPIHRIFFFVGRLSLRSPFVSGDKQLQVTKKWQTIGARLKRGNSQNCEQ